MAIIDRNTLKGWFRNYLKPTQEQFASWIDSFWHKSDKIPTSSIEGWDEFLQTIPYQQVNPVEFVETYADLPMPGVDGVIYYVRDEDEDYVWSVELEDYYDYVKPEGFLDTRMQNLENVWDGASTSGIGATSEIQSKLNVPTRGINTNTFEPQALAENDYRPVSTESLGGSDNVNVGNGSVSVGGLMNKNLKTAKGGVNIGGTQNENGGCLGVILGGALLKVQTFAEYAFGVANEVKQVFNREAWDDRDVLMSIGIGKHTNSGQPGGLKVVERLNAWTLYKYGVWQWKLRGKLSEVPVELLEDGMHGVDDNGRLVVYDTKQGEWQQYGVANEDGVEVVGSWDNPVETDGRPI